MTTYTQLRFSRTDGRSWDTGVSGYGQSALDEARAMATHLTRSVSVDYVEVIVEQRNGAITESSTVHRWSRTKGWH
jgi:hypothetical protein